MKSAFVEQANACSASQIKILTTHLKNKPLLMKKKRFYVHIQTLK